MQRFVTAHSLGGIVVAYRARRQSADILRDQELSRFAVRAVGSKEIAGDSRSLGPAQGTAIGRA